MHPVEHLRYVARAEGMGASALAREAAEALGAFAGDQPGLVTACRRLVERHPGSGPLWWLAARALVAADPRAAAADAADALDADPTPALLERLLPEDATVVAIGWPEQVGEALCRRGDLEVLLVEAGGEVAGLAHRLRRAGVAAREVPARGLSGAVGRADLVLLEASALGSDAFVATSGSRAAAHVAAAESVPVWVVAGEGRALPLALWKEVCARLEAAPGEAWEHDDEIVGLRWCEAVVGPAGRRSAAASLPIKEFPVPAELLQTRC